MQRKARAHDVYMAATKKMRERQYAMLAQRSEAGALPAEYARGWLGCLKEFSELVVHIDTEAT